MPRALVLGGGVAGIAACFELRDRGFEVELYEARRTLGGRVFSFRDQHSGEDLDNGPHVMLGCYDHMRRLLRRLGTEGDFVQPPSLSLVYRARGGRADRLALSRWPTPLAMPAALARLSALTVGERLRALRGMLSSLRGAPATWTLEDWLRARGQHGGPRRYLWEPLCFAVMNAEPAAVAAELFLSTLRRAFSGSAARAAIWIPRRPWSAIVGDAARDALPRAGVQVSTGHRITALEVDGDRLGALVLASGQRRVLAADDLVVSALPWHRLAAVLPPEVAGTAPRLAGRAIVNVYFDHGEAPVLPDEGSLVALLDGAPFQFLYRRPGDVPGRFALIGSEGAALEGQGVAAITALAQRQLADYYPGCCLPANGSARVTKEATATLLTSPSSVALRPSPGWHSRLANLALCGDWTQTRLPSTLEGAAESSSVLSRLVTG